MEVLERENSELFQSSLLLFELEERRLRFLGCDLV